MSTKRKLRSATTVVPEIAPNTKSSPSKKSKVAKKKGTDTTVTESRSEVATESKDDGPHYWLFKAEPETRLVGGIDVRFSIDDLKRDGRGSWDGVRNYTARNCMQSMKVGDLGFFYHSNCKMPGIVGVLKVVKRAYPDYTAFDTKHPYYDPKSDKDKPKWYMVDVEYVCHTKRLIGLHELKTLLAKDGAKSPLNSMALLRQGRLSVSPVKQVEWDYILGLSEQPDPATSDDYND
ncbi:PUA-like domain-containing protein [Lipomyces arxii]|uniref:PUA-like domain-containing protein n=1 Tax=Lipomyces arxii TaxID=56418 RepID=UPI0034CE8FC7